jgi:hypothetical protein
MPAEGRDTIFSIPPQYSQSPVILRFADLDGDGWREAILGVRLTTPISDSKKVQDSIIVYRFNPATQQHTRIASYVDIGLTDIETITHRSVAHPMVVVGLDGGGNDAVTYGKAILALVGDSLQILGYAPFGDPTLIEIDSLLVMEIHQTYSGFLAHAQAVEYADSLIIVGTRSAPVSYRSLLEHRIQWYRSRLDSLWNVRNTLTTEDQHQTVVSTILSIVNLESKQRGVPAARRTMQQLLRQWKSHLPRDYRELLEGFTDELSGGFAFER